MNMKKLVSSVAAFAMTASAFAGLAVTANADTLYSQDYEAGTVDWTTGTGGRFTPVILEEDGNKYLSVDQSQRQNNGTTITSSSLGIAAGTDFTLTFDLKLGSSTDQSPAAFNVMDAAGTPILSLTATGTYAETWVINSNNDQTVSLPGTRGNKVVGDLTWYTVKVTRSGDKEYLTITNKATGENAKIGDTDVALTTITNLSANGGIGVMNFVTRRYNANMAIDNVLVSTVNAETDVPSTPQGSYDVQYVTDDGTVLSKSGNGSGDAGTAPAISSGDKEAFVEDGQKYIYVSDNASSLTLDAENKVTVIVTVRKAASYNVTVNGVVNEATYQLGNSSVFEGDSWTYTFPKYLTDSDTKVLGTNDSEPCYASVTPEDNITVPVNYTAYEGTAQFIEAEDFMAGVLSNQGTGASSGYGKRVSGDAENALTVAADGIYNVTVAAFCRNTNNNSTYSVYVNGAAIAIDVDAKGASQNKPAVNTVENVELKAGDVISVSGDSGQTYIDYVLIEKTGDPTPELTVADVNIAEGDVYDQAGGNPAQTYTGTFTVTDKNYTVKAVKWTASNGEVTKDATSTFETEITGTTEGVTVVTGLVVSAADLSKVTVDAVCE